MFDQFFKKRRIQRGRELDPEEIFMDSVNLPGHDRMRPEGRIVGSIERSVFFKFALLMLIGLVVVFLRLMQLQYIHGTENLSASQKNISYTLFTAPPRGIIYDRNMKVIASNSASYALILNKRDFIKDDDFAAALKNGAALAGMSLEEIYFENNPGRNFDFSLPDNIFLSRVWPEKIVFINDIPHDLLLSVATTPGKFPGFSIEESIKRIYSGGPAFGPVVGFTGRPTDADRASSSFYNFGTHTVGKDGIELVYEEKLRGSPGKKIIEIDAKGSAQRERFIDKAVFGDHIVLNIDYDLEAAAYDALSRHIIALGKKAGSVVISDPRDGRILAMVNYPSFEPQILADGKNISAIRGLFTNKNSPLFNRAIAGIYAPGSTVKPVLATAALEEKIIDPEHEIYDEGFISVPNPYDPTKQTIFKDWSKLGWVDMRKAIAYSANVYFYTIGGGYGDIKGLGIERIGKFLSMFGFGVPSGIDLIGEKGGLVPSPEEKKKTRPADPFWRIGDTYISSIGQGDTGATPLQLNMATAAIANGGTLWRPFVTKAVLDEAGSVLEEIKPQATRTNLADQKSLTIVREGMRLAVQEGSAKSLGDLSVKIAGKTGTAQTGVVGKNHGWFTGFAPYDKPEMVITVLVEEGTGGSTDAVPIAKEILYAWMGHR
ncbi:MAG: penicillin-binding protein 2 [bacterium]|nr:penicillin-binding protein 2 [bacterium]